MEKLIKHQSTAELQRELSELNRLLNLHNENEFILLSLNFMNLEEFENYLLEKTGFKNLHMSATAMGLEEEYSKILINNSTIGDKFNPTDIENKQFKEEFIQSITGKHTEYLSDREIKIAKTFKKLISDFKNLELQPQEKNHIGFDSYGNLAFNPFSPFRNV
jgi:hypothetical protein